MVGKNTEKYFYAKGRRKNAVATVRLFEGEGKSTVNGKDITQVYPSANHQAALNLPFKTLDALGKYYFTAKTVGGGKTGQMGAISLAVSRALVVQDESNKTKLKQAGLMTRDPRMVERKKTGLLKARKAPQFSKR